jgi:uncharacterized membrane protein YhaH (DUF805 family)
MESLLIVLVENFFSVLKQYAVFKGRASRKEFWMFVFVILIMGIIFFILTRIPILRVIFWIVLILFILAIMIPSIALGIRRLHDINLSGMFLLLCLIPFLNVIAVFMLCVIEGNPHENQYGPVP